jgi:hypothetical protein
MKNPAERYQSYDEFIMALTAARSQLLVSQFRNQRHEAGPTSKTGSGKSWWRL